MSQECAILYTLYVSDCRDLVHKCLAYDAADRIALDDILKHPWFGTSTLEVPGRLASRDKNASVPGNLGAQCQLAPCQHTHHDPRHNHHHHAMPLQNQAEAGPSIPMNASEATLMPDSLLLPSPDHGACFVSSNSLNRIQEHSEYSDSGADMGETASAAGITMSLPTPTEDKRLKIPTLNLSGPSSGDSAYCSAFNSASSSYTCEDS